MLFKSEIDDDFELIDASGELLGSFGFFSMKKALLFATAVFGIFLMIPLAAKLIRPRVVHQRPYKWDKYVLPQMEFKQEPITNVVKAVNDAVRSASHGSIDRAVVLDATPASIKKIAPDKGIEMEMDTLILAFRKSEEDLLRRGAMGYEGAPYTGSMGGGHSLGCTFRMLVDFAELEYEERPDAIHLWRTPRSLECRAYRVTEGLTARIEQEHQASTYLVEAEPIISVLANVTEISSWHCMVPDGPNGAKGESRFSKVFKYLPESKIIIAIATPEEHEQAELKLKAAGLWAEVDPPSPR